MHALLCMTSNHLSLHVFSSTRGNGFIPCVSPHHMHWLNLEGPVPAQKPAFSRRRTGYGCYSAVVGLAHSTHRAVQYRGAGGGDPVQDQQAAEFLNFLNMRRGFLVLRGEFLLFFFNFFFSGFSFTTTSRLAPCHRPFGYCRESGWKCPGVADNIPTVLLLSRGLTGRLLC